MTLITHGHQDTAILGLYRHWQHLIWIFGLAKVLLLMLVNSSHGLHVLVPTGNFFTVIYTLNRMDNLKQFILLSAAQSMELQHSHMLGHIQLIKRQLFNIMFA
jgi:hypothetical protein